MKPDVSGSTMTSLWEVIRNPKTIAVFGASTDPNKIGGRPIDYMKRFGFEGKIIPINPNANEIQGLRAFPSLPEAGERIDAAIVVLPGQLAVEAVKEAAVGGARLCVVISSGFGEGVTGGGDDKLQEMLSIADHHGMRIVGPNTQGLASFERGAILSFSTLFNEYPPMDGPVGIVSQSGAMASVPYAMLRERGIGVRYAHATGNDSDLTVADIALSVLDDAEIKLLILYVENLADISGFRKIAAKSRSAGVPVHVVYGGLSPVGQQAALSHTGAMATGSVTVRAFFRRLGMWMAESLEELIDTVPIWLSGRIPQSGRLGALSSSGAACVLISDAAYLQGLEVPTLTFDTEAALTKRLPSYASANNPLDVTSALLSDSALIGDTLEILSSGDNFDAFIIDLPVTGVGYDVERFADDIQRIQAQKSIHVVTVLPNRASREIFQSRGLIVFEDTTRAVRAISNVVKHPALEPSLGADFESPHLPPRNLEAPNLSAEGTEVLLDEHIAGELLAQNGLKFARRVFISLDSPESFEEAVGLLREGKVVVKGVTNETPHKSDLGLVLTSVSTEDQLEQAIDSISRSARRNGIGLKGHLVYEQVDGYYELILGGRVDRQIGAVVMVGMGGKYAELDPDTRLLIPPFTRDYIETELKELRANKIFSGFRDLPAVDMQNLVTNIQALGSFLEENSTWVIDAEVNPLIASSRGFLGVDAVVHHDSTTVPEREIIVGSKVTR